MSHFISAGEYEDECDDLLAEAAAEQRYRNQLTRHPDPRDPDHPEWPDAEEDEE